MRPHESGRIRSFLGQLGATLGWHGLTGGLIALLAFAYGLGMLLREANDPLETEHEVLRRVLANWAQAPDYLGKNLLDYARDWRDAPDPSRPTLLGRLEESLRQLGENLERHDAQFPLINVVGMTLAHRAGDPVASWSPKYAPGASASSVADAIPVAEGGARPALELRVRYQVAPEVDSVVASTDRYYGRLIRALIALSGLSLLCFGYMVLHIFNLRDRVAREAAQGATLDLADRTCHELGNVAFVVANERRNLAGHIALIDRFLDEEPAARAAAARRAGLDPETAARFDQALRREYAEREIDPEFEIRQSAAMARDVCRQIAVCSDYIAMTVRELDGFLKQSELPVAIAPIRLADVFDEAVALLAPRLEAAGAVVERPAVPEAAATALGDRRLLVHALVNLVKNAVEAASGAGFDPIVSLTARPEGDFARIEVADNGPGIPDALRPRLFEDGLSTKGAGRGRGLAIVRESIRVQGGTIDLSNRPGGGTVFTIDLPPAPPRSVGP